MLSASQAFTFVGCFIGLSIIAGMVLITLQNMCEKEEEEDGNH